jgi:hypothetical protein
MSLSTKPTRRGLLAVIPALAVTVSPAATNALGAVPDATDDPIFAAITAVKATRQACNALWVELRKIEDTVPDDLDLSFPYGDRVRFGAGCFKGQPLYISSQDELMEVMTKRYLALLTERGVQVKESDDVLKDGPEKTWLDVELYLVRKHFNELMEMHERGRGWREQSGYDRVVEAVRTAEDVWREAQEDLVKTAPTTAAGLVALIESLVTDAPYEVDDWQDEMFPTIAETARKFLMA